MKHTREPWSVSVDGRCILKTYSPTKAKILVEGINFFNEDLNKGNIERIVACVNACQGITTEALKAGIVQEGLDAMKVVHLVAKPIISDSITELKTFMGVKIWEDSDGK